MKLLTILMLFGIASANAAPHKEARAPAPAPASSLEARGDITICVPDPVAVAECLPYIYGMSTVLAWLIVADRDRCIHLFLPGPSQLAPRRWILGQAS